MKKLFVLLFSCIVPLYLNAQGNNEDFLSFRKKMLDGYQGFRKNILDDYAKFLNGIWEDYEVFTGRKQHPDPKPDVQPVKKAEEPIPEPQKLEPEEVTPVPPAVEEDSPMPKTVVSNPQNLVTFDWCGLSMKLPDACIDGNLNGVHKEDLVSFLEQIQKSNLEKDVIPQIELLANSINMNDWCLCLLIQSYTKKIKANANDNTRNMICWYILVQFGYDVRLAFNGNHLFYLIPFQQQIYACNYITIKNTPYYIYGEGKTDNNEGFMTPKLPDGDLGSHMNAILLSPLKIPYRGKKFIHTFAGRTLSGEVNENLIRIMSHFPQLPIPAYAMSKGDMKARQQVLTQMKQFISGMSEQEAANFMLQFIQSYDYATDDEQFGYEKPFFLEETLYYPKCDCEDRAIFYHFLVANLLKRDIHLVHYPNHECNAVNFSKKMNADHYIYQGKQYVICDPTYIGATIGMCMPDFKKIKPEVELVK